MDNYNYLGKEWTNIVFEGRNKLYGAYKLREENVKNTVLALVLGIGSLSLVFGGSYLYASNKTTTVVKLIEFPEAPIETMDAPSDKKETDPIVEVKPSEKNETKLVSSARTDVQENIKFTETTIVSGNKETETLASQDMFSDATNPGVSNSDADLENGNLKADGSITGLATEGNEGTNRHTTEATTTVERVDNKPYTFVQHKAEPNEGFNKFYANFANKFSKDYLNTNSNEIMVRVKFVVEKDGSFSDIQVVDDKFGIGDEAKRILMNMPKWKAAEHNGKKVRSMFTLPIKIRLN